MTMFRKFFNNFYIRHCLRNYTSAANKEGKVALTSSHYTNIKRGHYSLLSDRDLDFFQRLLPKRIVTDQCDLEPFNVDWLQTCRGQSQLLLKPQTTQEVCEILKYCNGRCLAVVPQGGNTGLAGGSVPVFDEIILSTSLMNNVISFDSLSGVMQCQAGCVLENLEIYANDHGLSIPLDLGAKGSCHIGGNVATNAGGLRLLKYGSLHGNILGLEAVLADGSVLNCMSTLRKDNTGYDIKQLMIGSEGTLGVVTAVSILCVPKPVTTQVAFVGCESFERVKDIYKLTKSALSEILSAFEFLDDDSMNGTQENLGLRCPISRCPFYALIETSGSNEQHDEEKLTALLDTIMTNQYILDGTMATDVTKVKELWSLRELLAEAMLGDGYNFKYDLSIPLSEFYDIVDILRAKIGSKVTRIVGYGHVGDGNLHMNVTLPEYDEVIHNSLEPFVFDWVAERGGSISAEHGLGLKKAMYIGHNNSPVAIDLMKNIKRLLDPKWILNPYKVFPSDAVSNTKL